MATKRPNGRWLALLFLIALARLWLMALPSGFWVDETVTAFVVDRPGDPSFAVAPQVPASIYYAVARAAVKLFGTSEIAYRIPSVLAMLAAIWLISRLSARLIDPDSAWFAAFACLAVQGINYFAVDARPYSLGMLVAAGAVWFLVRWLDSASWVHAVGFFACAMLVWRVHLIYWPFYPVLAVYAAARLWTQTTKVSWAKAAAVFGCVALALVPVAVQALKIERQAGAHVIVAPPSWRDFQHLLRWNLVIIAAAGAWILRKFTQIGTHYRAGDYRLSRLLILMWWLLPPVLLYILSVSTGQSVFLTRYFSIALPGLALAMTLAAHRFLRAEHWRMAAALMGAGALVMLGHWGALWPRHEKSGWREAAATVNRLEGNADVPVICPSPFIEARWPEWRPDYHLPGFLYAHLAYYPLRGPLRLFPFLDFPGADAYAVKLLAEELAPRGEFLIYGGAGNTRFWQKWFAARPELQGWTNRRQEFGDVYVVRFVR